MAKEPPTLQQVAKVFLLGLTLRSYVVKGEKGSDGRELYTCLGHDVSRWISSTVDIRKYRRLRHRKRNRLMSPERILDYDRRHQKRTIGKVEELSSQSGCK
ncbi:hypothetical protein KR009_010762 [Drosophila setifemur]|nr:hypothetical protein KR009_010762 [Drosophila setifemur]